MPQEEEKKERSFEHNGIKYKVRRPSVEESQAANQLRSKTFNQALKNGKEFFHCINHGPCWCSGITFFTNNRQL